MSLSLSDNFSAVAVYQTEMRWRLVWDHGGPTCLVLDFFG